MINLECPYCFNTNEDLLYITDRGRTYHVHCDECGLQGPAKYSEEEAIEAFNELINKRYK